MEKRAVIADGVTPRPDEDKVAVKRSDARPSDPTPNRAKDGYDDDLAKRAADVVADRSK